MPSKHHPSALLLALASTACGAISISISTSLPASTISAGASDTSLSQLEQPVSLDPQNTGPAGSAELQSLTFTAADGATFDFLQSVHLFLDSSGLPEVEIANLTTVPPGQTSLSMNVIPGVDLLPYLQAGCTLRSSVTGTAPAQDFTFTGELVAQVGL